jgi:uncharacterized protein YegP (UPF0339 family)
MINIYNSKDGKYYFTITAKNNEILVTSETLNSMTSVEKSIKSLTKIFSKEIKIVNHSKLP